jgi:hypothetical protein
MSEPTSPASALSSEALRDPKDEEVVATFSSLIEAELAIGRLDAEGIAARIFNTSPTAIYAHSMVSAGDVKLYVAAQDLEAARAILFAPSALAEPMPEESPPLPVPTSDSADALALRASRAAIIGAFALPPILNFYSLVLLAQLAQTPGQLSARGRRNVALTITFDAIVLSLLGAIAYVLLT